MKWYVVYTQAGKEAFAAQNLTNQGFEPYLPRYRKRRRHARRIDMVLSPLFPRYLFVRMDPRQQRWRSINGTFGVSHLLTDGAVPQEVPDAIIDVIRAHADGDIVSVLPPAFRKGQRLQVTDGPFADIEGLFECVDDNQRVVLLLDFMGRAIKTSVPGHAVTAA
ncbi:MAG TPA: transcriptional activator RfaH [Rhodospirillaceae bacterium]|nr:transcriptional activator RfaH [Rhodospirillaceae bacterium]